MYNMKLEICERGQISGEVNIPIFQVLSSSLVHIYCGLAGLASFKHMMTNFQNSEVLQ